MRVFFGFDTAVAYWRGFVGSDDVLPNPVRTPLVAPGLPQVRRVEEALCELGLGSSGRAHVLASEIVRRQEGSAFRSHAWGREYPAGSFVKTGRDVLVESPELSFVRIAGAYPIARTIEYGRELCGGYALSQTDAGFRDRPAVTTPDRLRRYVQRADGMPGVKTARRACKYVVGGSASPMETIVYLLLCLPCALGGYGLPAPVMNARVVLEKGVARYDSTRRVVGRRYRVCDLYWPSAHVAIEYDGFRYHATKERLRADAVRRNELEERGEMVLTVTGGQVEGWRAMEVVAGQVARRVGHRLRDRALGTPPQRVELRKMLLSYAIEGRG